MTNNYLYPSRVFYKWSLSPTDCMACIFQAVFVVMRPLVIVPYLSALLLAVTAVRAGHSVHDPIEYYVSIQYTVRHSYTRLLFRFIVLHSVFYTMTTTMVAPYCFCGTARTLYYNASFCNSIYTNERSKAIPVPLDVRL